MLEFIVIMFTDGIRNIEKYPLILLLIIILTLSGGLY